MPRAIRVAVFDDHSLFREGLASLFARDPAFALVVQGATALEAIKAITKKLDLMLLDLAMPGDVQEAIRAAAKGGIKVCILTASEDVASVVTAFELGALGYILKGIGSSDFFGALTAIARGEEFISPSLLPRLLELRRERAVVNRARSFRTPLTPREEEILNSVADGLTNKEIAQKFDLAERTVKNYVSSILRKMKVKTRTKMALLANAKK